MSRNSKPACVLAGSTIRYGMKFDTSFNDVIGSTGDLNVRSFDEDGNTLDFVTVNNKQGVDLHADGTLEKNNLQTRGHAGNTGVSDVGLECTDCPNPESTSETSYVSGDGNFYNLVNGKWIIDFKSYYNTTLAEGTTNWAQGVLLTDTPILLFTKSSRATVVGVFLDYMNTVGVTELKAYQDYLDKFYTPQQQQAKRDNAKSLVLKHKGVLNPQTGKREFDE